jgi:LCP family protein required for cell wall assembly
MRRTTTFPDRTTILTVALLALLAVGMHAYLAVVVGRLDAVLDRVFVTAPAAPAEEPAEADPIAAPEPEPEAIPQYRWDGTERLNFLLIGVDSGPGRDHALTDTIMVVSVDPAAHEAVLVSIPRDTGFMPLPDARIYADGLYPDKVNSLASVADADPELWCPELLNVPGCGIRTLARSVSLYLGIAIHYYAVVDLVGFEGLIDALGGVRLCLPGRLVDPEYVVAERDAAVGIELAPGCRDYSGEEALAFARIRKGTLILPNGTEEEQDDFKRAARQQEVILALRSELAETDLFFELPGLLEAVGRTVRTDFPREKAGDLASLLPLITGPDIERVVLGAPEFTDLPPAPDVNYLLTPRRDAVREEAQRLFGDDGDLQGWYVGSDDPGPPPSTGEPSGAAPIQHPT